MPLGKLFHVAGLAACALLFGAATDAPRIEAARIKEHVRVLASDALQGREPGQRGEAKTLDYLVRAFRAAGLQPAGEAGGWLQKVRLADYTRVAASITVDAAGGSAMPLVPGQDVTVSSRLPGRTTVADAPIVFVGYGVEAPELGRDDFAGTDLKGKVAIFLANDPDFDQADGPFGGPGLSYFGRVSAKIEAAQRHGAVAALIIHQMPASRIPWATYAAADAAPVTDIDGARSPFGMRGWIEHGAAAALFRRAGLDLDELAARARAPQFRAVPLPNVTLSATIDMRTRPFVTHNVLAKLPGTSRSAETVLFGAHWDAFGIGAPDALGDSIRNGAVDDATGLATMIEVARAFARGPRLPRTLVFAAWSAEEKDLLGSSYYVQHPLTPLASIVGVINLDPHRFPDAARDVEIMGPGRTDLEHDLARVAAARGLAVSAEIAPEAGWYFRSDQFPFAHAGVPVLYFRMGQDLVEGGTAAGKVSTAAYMSKRYHKPADNFDPEWNMAGSVQEGELAYLLGRQLASRPAVPCWMKGPAAWEHRDARMARECATRPPPIRSDR